MSAFQIWALPSNCFKFSGAKDTIRTAKAIKYHGGVKDEMGGEGWRVALD